MKKILLTALLALILLVNVASAVSVQSVSAQTLTPGQEGTLRIEVENVFEDDVEEVSLALQFANLPFIPIGTSEGSVEEIKDGDEEDFAFRVKAANDISPGDYEIPYTIKYSLNGSEKTRSGSIGIEVTAQPELSFTVNSETPVLDRQGQITLRIVNSGFADAKFVSVRVLPSGFTLLSEPDIYIGEVDSDDFETASFDVKFESEEARFIAVLDYTDFDNRKKIENINMPLTVYSQEKAIELGIIEKNNTPQIILAIVILIILWFIYRSIRKRRRLKRSMQNR